MGVGGSSPLNPTTSRLNRTKIDLGDFLLNFKGWPDRKIDTGKTAEGSPYARIVSYYGHQEEDDEFGISSVYIYTIGENVSIGIVDSSYYGVYFRVYNYDEEKEDSSLVLSTEKGEPTPEEFMLLHKEVESAISANTQNPQQTE